MSAATAENVAPVSPTEEDEEKKYGFQREEMYKSDLAHSAGTYDRHVFLCYKSSDAWPSRVEDSEDDFLPMLLSGAIKARQNDIPLKTKLTICEGAGGTKFSDGDVLIFPDMITYRGLKESEVDTFVDHVLVNNEPWDAGEQEQLTGSHVFVCSHSSRDKRCGVCGPVLIEKLKKEIELRGVESTISVTACSHIGGHKYAGNLIVYSPNGMGEIMGHWYGYVTPDDVPEIINDHIGKGKIIERLWRGQMGAYGKKEEKSDEQKKNEKLQEGNAGGVKDNGAGCCQGVREFSCCRDGDQDHIKGNKSEEKNGLCKLTSWCRKLEQNDIFLATAVVGAVATIAVAYYGFYRRSG